MRCFSVLKSLDSSEIVPIFLEEKGRGKHEGWRQRKRFSSLSNERSYNAFAMGVQETINELEKKRKEAQASFIITLVFGSLLCLSSEALILYGGLSSELDSLTGEVLVGVGLVLFFFFGLVFSRHAITISKSYKKDTLAALMPYLTPKKYQDFSYKTDYDLTLFAKAFKQVLSVRPDRDQTSYFEGRFPGATFFSFAYSYIRNDAHLHGEIQGRYVKFTLPHEFPFEMIMKDKRSPSYFKKKQLLIRLKSDSASFDATHDVTANKEVEGMNLLSPKMIQAVEAINADYGVKLSARFRANKVYVYFDDYHARYLIALDHPLNLEAFDSLEDEILLVYRSYKALNLDSSFYSI